MCARQGSICSKRKGRRQETRAGHVKQLSAPQGALAVEDWHCCSVFPHRLDVGLGWSAGCRGCLVGAALGLVHLLLLVGLQQKR